MTKENPTLAALDALGFERQSELVRFGVWQDYAVCLRALSATTVFIAVAIRSSKKNTALSRELSRSLKEQGVKGLVLTPVAQKVQFVTFKASFKKTDEVTEQFRRFMAAIVAVLRENGLAPADTCAISGTPMPDSLCLMTIGAELSYQPVNGALIHEQNVKAREKAEENETNGSYALGLVGALLGMLVGIIPTLLTIIAAEKIFAWLFALVPIAAFFGYKLFRGKMNKGALVIVILVSLLGVVMIPLLELAFFFMKDYGDTLGGALQSAFYTLTDGDFLKEMAGDLLKLLLFMGLGIFFSLGVILGHTNADAVSSSQAQLNSLRPNPARDAE